MSKESRDAESLSSLNAKRGVTKGRLTKFKNYVDNLLTLETISTLEISKLVMKLSRIETLFIEFDELQSRLELLNVSDLSVELTTRDIFEQDFDTYISLAQQVIKKHTPSKSSETEMTSNMSAQATLDDHHHSSLGFKLPVIKIPNFDGTYYKWLEFKETFISLVHDNERIKNIHKFHYLNSYLEGEAARVLCNLEVSAKNYPEAWNLLCERFDNKRQLINNHLKSLFSFESVRETDKSLRFVIDHVTKNLRALSTLGLPTDKWDILIIYMVTAKLDNTTCFKWEEHRNNISEIPTLSEFFNFLKCRADVLETVFRNKQERQGKPGPFNSTSSQPKPQTRSYVVTSKDSTSHSNKHFECAVCKENHRLYECSTFKSKSPEDRNSIVKSLKLCQNCFRTGHSVDNCKLPGSCRVCKKRHNSLLHIHKTDQTNDSNNSLVMSALSSHEILLCTAKVRITNPNSNLSISVRALLDSGSQSSFISLAVMRQLNLTSQPSNVNVIGIGQVPLNQTTERCGLQLQSEQTSFKVSMFCLVLPKISDNLPKVSFDSQILNLPNVKLADPSFNKPSTIDMLIGADLFWELIGSKQISLGKNKPILRDSKLGWLVAGPLPTFPTPKSQKQVICNFVRNNDYNPNDNSYANIEKQMSIFWEIENLPQTKAYTTEEKLCEQHFISNTIREDSGRFCVALPLRESRDCLGSSYPLAKKRFINLEARFRKQPELKKAYSEFVDEYTELGHLSEIKPQIPYHSYYLPHHPVIREKSESTKLRVVFDASARTSSGFSVNNIQMVGPTVQDSLFNILLRFRQYRYIVSGDIEKMYRQVNVRESDRSLQLILWRKNEDEPLQTFQLNTVTYGFSSASFLSTRCIWQLGEECDDPKIKIIIQNDFYCDDLLTGSDSAAELCHIQRSVAEELSKGCFNLRKYRSNFPELFTGNKIENEEGNLIISHSTNTLGIGWSPDSDKIHFEVEILPIEVITKRSILSTTFKIFDPLGLLSLCTIKPKIMLQRLWSLKIDWDEPVPQEIQASWLKFTQNVHHISSLEIQRRVLVDNYTSIEMHCFCDASQQAYGACIYLKSTNEVGDSQIHLLTAKARVAPLKSTTIPRLELCACLLGAQLGSSVEEALRCKIDRRFYWTDSSVVLGWLKSPHKTKTFVANRIAAIGELTDTSMWKHVPTADNPADFASRGTDPQNLKACFLWWYGPSFLRKPESCWPTAPASDKIQLPELKTVSVLAAEVAPSEQVVDFYRFSVLSKLQRVYARVFRFYHNCKNPKNKITNELQVCELNKSIEALIIIAQNESYSIEISLLKVNKPLPVKKHLSSLNPFVDEHGILRVGGRINNSNYSFEKRHPIVLNADHILTKLIFQQEHLSLFHAGPQHLLASVRNQYWPIGGRNLARKTVRNCHVCRRFKGQTMSNIMGNLPNERVEPDFPFNTVATDFAGPFYITDRKGRGCKITKCYLCIFICFRYKCVHLEAVSELSKQAFILTLNRFIARRGIPKIIYCDNGRNFVAAAKEIFNFVKSNKEAISGFGARRGIEFKFSPAYAPHFNGLAEAGIKSAKNHIRKVLGSTHLTFEELSSLFAQVEAILNSRPLCPLSSSPNDYQSLTPAHFIIGRSLTSLPSPSLMNCGANRIDRFQRLEQARQHFWGRWASEYVSELQQRMKWRINCKNLSLNDLVLIKEDNIPPLCWRLGRVAKLFPGNDGVPRVADITTSQGTVRRALNRLCLLPNSEESS